VIGIWDFRFEIGLGDFAIGEIEFEISKPEIQSEIVYHQSAITHQSPIFNPEFF
jgi:hypothetical protein